MRLKAMSALLIFVVMIGCGAFKSPASVESSSSIKGLVLDPNGVPIGGVNISTTPTTNSVYTNDQGIFEISNIDEGSYLISGVKDGFKQNSVTITATAGETVQASLMLNPTGNASIKGVVLDSDGI